MSGETPTGNESTLKDVFQTTERSSWGPGPFWTTVGQALRPRSVARGLSVLAKKFTHSS